MSGPEFQAVEREMAPRLAAFFDQITQNEALFKRIAAVYDSRDRAGLTPEQKRLAWLDYTNFVRAGARLDTAKRMSEINQRLAELFTSFSQNVLADETDYVLFIETEADLAGLPPSLRSAAAAAEGRGHKGQWAILNTRSSMEPFLTYSDRRDLREKVWRTYFSRGDNGGAHDTNATITEILKLRAERATMLGYATHAHWRLENSMARNPERAMELMEAVWPPAVARVHQEVADMQAIADKEGSGVKIAPWDYRYYAEKVRKARFDLDQNEVKPYLQLDKLRDGMFWMAGRLFDFHFSPITDVPYPSRRQRLRGGGRNGQARRPLVLRSVGASRQEVRRMDELLPAPGALRRRGHRHRLQQRQLREGPRGDARAGELDRRRDPLPRVRPRPPRPLLQREVPVSRGHRRSARLRRVPVPAPRALALHAGGPEPVRDPLRNRQAHSGGPRRQDPAGGHVQPGVHDRRVPGERPRRHEAAPRGESHHRTRRVRARDPRGPRHARGRSSMPSPDAAGQPRLRATTLGPLLQLPVGRHATTADAWRRSRRPATWDAAVAERLRDTVLSVGNTVDPAEAYRAFRGRDAGIAALMRKRGFPVPPAKPQ